MNVPAVSDTARERIRVDRLMVVATMLEEISEDPRTAIQFDLEQWVGVQEDGRVKRDDATLYDLACAIAKKRGDDVESVETNLENACVEPEPILDCGFAACAIGWAGTLPVFREQGFCIVGETGGYLVPHMKRDGMPDLESWEAVSEFFGLTHRQAEFLFMPKHYSKDDRSDPLAVRAHIMALLKDATK